MQIEGGLFGNVWFLGTSPAGMGSLLHGSCGAGGEGRGQKGCVQFGGKVSFIAHLRQLWAGLGSLGGCRVQDQLYGPVLSAGSWDSEQRRSDQDGHFWGPRNGFSPWRGAKVPAQH